MIFIIWLIWAAYSLQGGNVKSNYLLPMAMEEDGEKVPTKVVIDANWRWVRFNDGYSNCFTDKWQCGDPIACSNQCTVSLIRFIFAIIDNFGSNAIRYTINKGVE